MRRTSLAAAVTALGLAIGGPTAVADASAGTQVAATTPAAAAAAPTSGARPVHRVVWDAGDAGAVIMSARLDGSDQRTLYRERQAETTSLTLSRLGDRVAFAPYRFSDGRIVVAPTTGGPAVRVVGGDTRIDSIGGIGWAPGGQRLVFEAVDRLSSGEVEQSLWTVRADGSKLTRLIVLRARTDTDDGGRGGINEQLAWTDRGVLFSNGTDLRALERGQVSTLVPRVSQVAVSGDGRTLALERRTRQSIDFWTSRADGSQLRRHGSSRFSGTQYAGNTQPRYDGTRFLDTIERSTGPDQPSAGRTLDVIDDQMPSRKVRSLRFAGDTLTYAWN